jgi:glutathione S-transferase
VEAALVHIGAPFDLVELDSEVSTPLPQSFHTVNPWGQVPTLLLPDATVMTGSAAILIHLAACHPDKGLGPAFGTSEHATFMRWMICAEVNVYEAGLRATYPFRYTTDAQTQDATRAAGIARMGEALQVLEAVFDPGPFLLGEKMSVADPYIAWLLRWYADYGENLGPLPRLTDLADRAAEHPSVAPSRGL